MTDYKIRKATNYEAFKTVLGNRKVRTAHVKKLKLSIEKDPESIKYNPILVNEKMEVIDGQHRLEAIKSLELPVYYVKVPGLKLEDVQKLNSVSKQWGPVDYAQAFAKLGNDNYQVYLDVKSSELSINHDSLLRYLALDNPITSESFKEGRLVVQDPDRSHELLTMRLDMEEFHERAHIRPFALAFLRLAQEEGYSHKRMLQQMGKYAHKYLEAYSKEQDYFKALNRVYNHHKKEKVHFGDVAYLMQ